MIRSSELGLCEKNKKNYGLGERLTHFYGIIKCIIL